MAAAAAAYFLAPAAGSHAQLPQPKQQQILLFCLLKGLIKQRVDEEEPEEKEED